MKVIAVIPSRYGSSRFPGKPLKDICGKPMLWWVYQQLSKAKGIDEIIVATDDKRIYNMCKENDMNVLMTSPDHSTPTDRLYEVSIKTDGDIYMFVGGDEPLIDPASIEALVPESETPEMYVANAMTTIKTAPEVIDFTNIKVVVNEENIGLYTSRSPLPYPKGGLDFEYKKFVGIGAFSRKALDFYYHTPKGKMEAIEECDLMRFIEHQIPIKFFDVECRNISVDTPKDLEKVREIMAEKLKNNLVI